MLNQKELKALITLLDDPDEHIYEHVREKLLSMGHEVIPVLEHVWEMGDPFNHTVQTRIENIIHKIQYDSVTEEICRWAEYDSDDLLKGALLIAKYQYPDLDLAKTYARIDQITQDVWLELSDDLTALEKIKILNHIIFEVHGFSGNTSNFHAPQNSYLNNVIESKKGNPLSLSILYAVVAQRLQIPIAGVNLPEHFILAYKADDDLLRMIGGDHPHGVLFYINPFSRGAVFGTKEIEGFLKQLKLNFKDSYFEPCNNIDIVIRLIRNLVNSYDKLGYPKKQEELNALLTALASRGFGESSGL